MMRVLKYMYLSIKILLLPVVIALLVYFRPVIFQPHISQYADDAQMFLEQRYDISIPVHVNENLDNDLDINKLSVNSQNIESDDATNSLLDKSVIGDFQTMTNDSIVDNSISNDKASVKVKSLADTSSPGVIGRVVEQEIFIILNNDSSKKSLHNDSVENYSVEKVNHETVDSKVITTVDTMVGKSAEIIIETQTVDVNDEPVHKINQEMVDGNNKVIDPAVMEKLSDTIDIINRKVDMLFNINELNKDTIITAKNTDDFAIINNKKEKIELEADITSSINVEYPRNTRDMLLVARQTFWNGNPLDSEKLYLDLAKLHGNNPNIYGELGNVYYSQGKWEKAGKAYYQAAVRLLDLKQTQQVNYLLRVIEGLDAESAEKLKLKISG